MTVKEQETFSEQITAFDINMELKQRKETVKRWIILAKEITEEDYPGETKVALTCAILGAIASCKDKLERTD